MTSFIKKLVGRIISIWYCKSNPFLIIIEKYMRLSEYVYTQKYCRLFNCEDVVFIGKINLSKGEQYFSIGKGTGFEKHVVLTAWDNYKNISYNPKVTIGENCNFGEYLHLTCINKISIGDGVLTGRWVTISDNDHGSTDYLTLQTPPVKRELLSKGTIEIGNNVWIGDKATILSGVKIGEGTVIAANSVVTKNIPPYSVAAGNPAKVIKQNIIDKHE